MIITFFFFFLIYRNTQRKRVGICTYDGFFTPSVSCVRAVNIAARSLEKQGYNL